MKLTMPQVKFTSALQRFFPSLQNMETEGQTVLEVVESINQQFPGLKNYLLDEDGSLRKHVNIFLKEELIRDRNQLSDPVKPSDEVLIFQALSGG